MLVCQCSNYQFDVTNRFMNFICGTVAAYKDKFDKPKDPLALLITRLQLKTIPDEQ